MSICKLTQWEIHHHFKHILKVTAKISFYLNLFLFLCDSDTLIRFGSKYKAFIDKYFDKYLSNVPPPWLHPPACVWQMIRCIFTVKCTDFQHLLRGGFFVNLKCHLYQIWLKILISKLSRNEESVQYNIMQCWNPVFRGFKLEISLCFCCWNPK